MGLHYNMETLNDFLKKWDQKQQEEHNKIEMFNPEKVSSWTVAQK